MYWIITHSLQFVAFIMQPLILGCIQYSSSPAACVWINRMSNMKGLGFCDYHYRHTCIQDGLVCVFDLATLQEEDALLAVKNSNASVVSQINIMCTVPACCDWY